MPRVRALFILAAFLIGLLPATALAHRGVDHGAVASDVRSHEAPALFALAEPDAWTPACPPGSGHVCGCGNLSLCDGGAKDPVLPAAIAFVHFASIAAANPVGASQSPASSPQFPPNLPRAPPQLS